MALSLLFVSSCGLKPSALPQATASGWLELKTAHFTLLSNAEPAEARQVSRQLEQAFALLAGSLSSEPLDEVHTTVVAFKDYRDFEAYEPTGKSLGYYFGQAAGDLEPQPTFVVAEAAFYTQRAILMHELTHRMLNAIWGAVPVWLDEGLAGYFSTLRVEGRRVLRGEPARDRGFTRERQWSSISDLGAHSVLVPLKALVAPSKLMRLSRSEFYARSGAVPLSDQNAARTRMAHYTSAWAWVHLLMNGDAKYTAAFEKTLRTATGTNIRDAFSQVFQQFPDSELDRDFWQYLDAGRVPVFSTTVPYGFRTDILQERALPAFEALSLLARLSQPRQAEQLLQHALQSAPKRVELRVRLARVRQLLDKFELARSGYAAVLREFPEHVPALQGYLELLRDERAPWSLGVRLSRAVPLMVRLMRRARSARQFELIAHYLLAVQDVSRSASAAQHACELDVNCWQCHEAYVAALFKLGDRAAALREQEAALGQLPESSSTTQVARSTALLLKYRLSDAQVY